METRRSSWPSAALTLVALDVVFVVGTTCFTVELERLMERAITPQIATSPEVAGINRASTRESKNPRRE